MNSFDELVSHGIEEYTAEEMLRSYRERIGTMNGVYKIVDIEYDFSNKGKIVTLQCSKCGKIITKLMIKGRYKWRDLIQTCPCQKEENAKIRKMQAAEKSEKIKRQKIMSRIGEVHGDYEIVSVERLNNSEWYIMRCLECGAEKKVSAECFQNVKNFHCTKHYVQQIKFDESYIGEKNNHLTVIGITRDKVGQRAFLCKCDCGKEVPVKPTYWENGKIKSCGCKHNEYSTTHGGSKERLYKVWGDMKSRCYNKNSACYMNYGGRGIMICEEWIDDYSKFREWAYSNGYDENAPFGECTIDRIDVNGNYEPSNCRWITNVEQQKNKRPPYLWKKRVLKKGKKYLLNGEVIVSETELCKRYGISTMTFKYRVNHMGLGIEEALTMPKIAPGRPRKTEFVSAH